jgi:putative ABC transport system permease protein
MSLHRLVTEVGALPGVVAAGVTSSVPLGGGDTSMSIGPIPRNPAVPPQGIQASWRIVSSDYFRALGAPILRGRTFTLRDNVAMPVILSAGLARKIFPDGSEPVGRRVWISNGQEYEVIGVVGDIRLLGLNKEAEPAMYFPTTWGIWPRMTLTVRTTVDPVTLTGSVRQVLARVEPNLPLFDVRTMDDLVARNAARPRLQTTLIVLFAGIALTLGIVGNVGVIAFAVARRTPELAVRLALGATPGQVMRDVMRRGLMVCAVGLSVGVAGAWLLGHSLSALLYEVRPDDPGTQIMTALALLMVAMIACWLPARRATRIDPVTALRGE